MFEEAHAMKETKFECSFIRWLNLHFWLGINSLKVPGDSQESVLIHQLHHISLEKATQQCIGLETVAWRYIDHCFLKLYLLFRFIFKIFFFENVEHERHKWKGHCLIGCFCNKVVLTQAKSPRVKHLFK